MITSLPDQNWEFLLKLLPCGWEEAAHTTGAVKRQRGFGSVGDLLRGLLLHVGLGCSLRETVVVSKAAGWLQMSDVALLKKLRQSERWLQTLCLKLLEESEIAWPADKGIRMRLVDGTHVKEPGQTGSQWRVHYSLSVPEWTCDFFGLTSCKGAGTGESLCQYPVRPGDCLVGDRGYAQAAGIAHVHRRHGFVLVRHNAQTLPLAGQNGSPLDVLAWLRNLKQAGQLDSQAVWVPVADGPNVPARLCAVRKSEEAIIASRRKICRRAQRKSQELRPETLEYAQWVMALTTVPAGRMDARTVLEWYRIRWQVELAFKRLKSLADFGHLPKRDPASCRAWLYGKLLVALLTERMQRYAGAISPWGGNWCGQEPPPQPVA